MLMGMEPYRLQFAFRLSHASEELLHAPHDRTTTAETPPASTPDRWGWDPPLAPSGVGERPPEARAIPGTHIAAKQATPRIVRCRVLSMRLLLSTGR